MKTEELLPVSLRHEMTIPPLTGLFFAALFFLVIYLPWAISPRELYRKEGLYAVCASEYRPGSIITAHQVVQRGVWPLFPAAAAALHRIGVPVPQALRLVSLGMSGAWAILAGTAAAKRRNLRAGAVTFCCCCGTLLALEKGIDGGPESMTAFFLLAAQLAFFHFGNRHANWNAAWIWSAVLLSLAFLSGGFQALLFFLFPMFFLRRPLSVRSKFKSGGIIAGAAILLFVVLLWTIPAFLHPVPDTTGDFSLPRYCRHLLFFPLLLPLRLLPWSVIAWLPFCVALQEIDPTPVYSRYLRTLFFPTLLLLWLLPFPSAAELSYAVGPLAIMTGLNYDLGVRRYSGFLRKTLKLAPLLLTGEMAILILFAWLPDQFPALFRHIFHAKSLPAFLERLEFRSSDNYLWIIVLTLAALLLCGGFLYARRKTAPVWALIAAVSCALGLFYTAVVLPYRETESSWRTLSADITAALPENDRPQRLYKGNIDGLYSGLFYTGIPVTQLHSADELPKTGTVYLLSPAFPPVPERAWVSLLPQNYRCQGNLLYLWKGTTRQEEQEDSGDADGDE